MAVLITAFVAGGCLLLVQAVHILKTGSVLWFFIPAPSEGSSHRLSRSKRAGGALLFGGPGCALLVLVAVAAVRNDKSAILSLIAADFGEFVGGLFFFTFGLLVVLWPGWMLRAIQAWYPNVDLRIESVPMRGFIRVLAALVMAAGLFLLSLVK
jgi:hypothetical protein